MKYNNGCIGLNIIMNKYKSIVVWPKEVSVGNVAGESQDYHKTRGEAEFVCKMIQKIGLEMVN